MSEKAKTLIDLRKEAKALGAENVNKISDKTVLRNLISKLSAAKADENKEPEVDVEMDALKAYAVEELGLELPEDITKEDLEALIKSAPEVTEDDQKQEPVTEPATEPAASEETAQEPVTEPVKADEVQEKASEAQTKRVVVSALKAREQSLLQKISQYQNQIEGAKKELIEVNQALASHVVSVPLIDQINEQKRFAREVKEQSRSDTIERLLIEIENLK